VACLIYPPLIGMFMRSASLSKISLPGGVSVEAALNNAATTMSGLAQERPQDPKVQEANTKLKSAILDVQGADTPSVDAGWIYLGNLDPQGTWAGARPSTIKNVSPADLDPAKKPTLYITDDVYLHKNATQGERAVAPVLGVIKEGKSVTMLDKDLVPIPGGGFHVWARVQTHS
jgi:hypothetical protein